MSVKIVKIRILPVPERRIRQYMRDLVLSRIEPVKEMIDNYGKKYEHENPWTSDYLSDSSFYLYRVKIGAIGRINTCEDAIEIGIMHRIATKSYHFTSMALYYVFRIAREIQREIHYTSKLETWIDNLKRNKQAWGRFVNYNSLESTYDDEKEE